MQKTSSFQNFDEYRLWQKILILLLTAGIAGILLSLLYPIDLQRPFTPLSGDLEGVYYYMKAVIENGWAYTSARTGGINGAELFDYPMTDYFFYGILRVIGLFTKNIYLVFNLFYLTGFILTAVSGAYAFLKLGISIPLGVVLGQLYSFTFYHQFRVGHTWLSFYYVVPLSCLTALWLAEGKLTEQAGNCPKRQENEGTVSKKAGSSAGGADLPSGWSRQDSGLFRRRGIAFVICVLISISGFYYALFSCALFLTAFLINLSSEERKRRGLASLSCLFLTAFFVMLTFLPTILYWRRNGQSPTSELSVRDASDAESFGLKIIQLLLPQGRHRILPLQKMVSAYNEAAPLVNENMTVSLGLVAAIGFLGLLLVLFLRRGQNTQRSSDQNEWIASLAAMNLASVLIATVGGLGAFVSYFLGLPIRSYNRMGVFISFFSLAFSGILLEAAFQAAVGFFRGRKSERKEELPEKGWGRTGVVLLLSILLLAVGIYDQTYTVETDRSQWETLDAQEAFIRELDQDESINYVFQLPYLRFPTDSPYQLFRGYLFSDRLHWSYGGMDGRSEDRWESWLNTLEVREKIKQITWCGYDGIYVDLSLLEMLNEDGRFDREAYLGEIEEVTRVKPISSRDGSLCYFSLSKYRRRLIRHMGEESYREWCERAVATMNN